MYVDPRIVRDWIALQHARENTPEYDRLFPVFEVVYDMTHERPEEGWAFVLEVLSSDNSKPVVESLSAGFLEDLLTYHGAALIDRVEAEARRNPKFASLLGGVWKAMADDIWERIQGVWDRGGWDDVPAD